MRNDFPHASPHAKSVSEKWGNIFSRNSSLYEYGSNEYFVLIRHGIREFVAPSTIRVVLPSLPDTKHVVAHCKLTPLYFNPSQSSISTFGTNSVIEPATSIDVMYIFSGACKYLRISA